MKEYHSKNRQNKYSLGDSTKWSTPKNRKRNTIIPLLFSVVILSLSIVLFIAITAKERLKADLNTTIIERDSLLKVVSSVDSLKRNLIKIDRQLSYLRELSTVARTTALPIIENYYKNDTAVAKIIKKSQKDQYFLYTPNITPLSTSWITKEYKAKEHEAIDYISKLGTPIRVTANGIVDSSYFDEYLGNVIIITHNYGYKTLYGHCQSLLKKKGETLTRGDIIATLGNSGSSTTGPHLHYEVTQNGKPLNPKQLIMKGF